MKRAAVWTGMIAVLAGVVALLAPPAIDFPLAPGVVYEISNESGRSEIDLPLSDTAEHYLLVVSNLADDPDLRDVSFSVQSIKRAEHAPLRIMPTMESKPLSADARACQPPPTPVAAKDHANCDSIGSRRSFWLHYSEASWNNPAAHRRIESRLVARGPHVRVYVDVDDAVDLRTTNYIVQQFERSVRPTLARYLGLPQDVDGDGTLAIFLTGWMNRLENGQSSLGGMVRPSDFQRERKAPFSNRADVLFLNPNVHPGPHLQTLLVHELAHAVTTSGKLRAGSLLSPAMGEEAWLNEAISHVVENLHSDNFSNLDHRVASFLARPSAAPLVVPNYFEAGLSGRPEPRGSTYLFLRWCVERHGPELLRRLVHSPRHGIGNLEAASGSPFDRLYRNFSTDLFLATAGVVPQQRSPAAQAALPSLDLAREIGAWGLAGPRYENWDVADPQQQDWQISLAGTSTQFVVVNGMKEGARRLTISAADARPLQVSLVRLPNSMARLRAKMLPRATGGWQLHLDELSGTAVTVSQVVWQQEAAEGQSHRTRPHGRLRAEQLSEWFDDAAIPPGGSLISRPPLFADQSAGVLTLAVVGLDEHGHRVTAWTTVDLSDRPLRIASAD